MGSKKEQLELAISDAVSQLHRIAVKAPPIKTQGIKTKLVQFIADNIDWNGRGKWVEPFLGSGVVLLNLAPDTALVSDTNQHIINTYKAIQSGEMTGGTVRAFLEREGETLNQIGESYYYDVRERFNEYGSPMDFLFLNRSCFNGVMRFNGKGKFNVPFCKKPNRFAPAYVTKICNQVDWASMQMRGKKWEFVCGDWSATLDKVEPNDFVYLDPPYVGRHTDYYNQWSEEVADNLAEAIKSLSCKFAYSMWKENKYRVNEQLLRHFSGYREATLEHFYHVGSKESLRNSMTESLILK